MICTKGLSTLARCGGRGRNSAMRGQVTVPPTHKHPTVSLIGDVEPKVPRAVSRVPRSRMKGKQPCPGARGKVPEPSPPG